MKINPIVRISDFPPLIINAWNNTSSIFKVFLRTRKNFRSKFVTATTQCASNKEICRIWTHREWKHHSQTKVKSLWKRSQHKLNKPSIMKQIEVASKITQAVILRPTYTQTQKPTFHNMKYSQPSTRWYTLTKSKHSTKLFKKMQIKEDKTNVQSVTHYIIMNWRGTKLEKKLIQNQGLRVEFHRNTKHQSYTTVLPAWSGFSTLKIQL